MSGEVLEEGWDVLRDLGNSIDYAANFVRGYENKPVRPVEALRAVNSGRVARNIIWGVVSRSRNSRVQILLDGCRLAAFMAFSSSLLSAIIRKSL